jgi:nucleoside-diphosphate kinase
MQTLVLCKPDAVRRNLIGEVIRRCEQKGYMVAKLVKLAPSRQLLAQHYLEHEGKPFYEPLMEFMLSGEVVAIALEGERVMTQHLRLRAPSGVTSEEIGERRLFRTWFMAQIRMRAQHES